MKNLSLLSQDILPSGCKKVAIVGNSGVDSSDEDFIRDADAVVRFNNYATREKINHTKDPFRCDILFTTFDLHSQGSKPKDVVIGIPFPFKAEEIYRKPQRWYPDSRLWMVNPYENMAMCREMKTGTLGYQHPFPSIGFTALWHMKDWDIEFYVCGFSWYYDQMTHRFQGWDLKNTDYPKNWNHNYPRELKWIIENLTPKHNFMFSKRCSDIIRIAQHITGWRA